MKLQNIILPSTDTCTEEAMYFRRGNNVEYSWCSDHILIKKNGMVGFDTYFNGFSAEKWFKYSAVKNISLHIRLSGSLRVTLMRKEKLGERILTEFVGEYLCETENEDIKEFTLPFSTPSVNGMYCFEIFGIGKKSKFYGGCYETDTMFINHVKIGINICTYKRENFIGNNLDLLNRNFLNNKDSFLFDKLEIFISDNAHTLKTDILSSDKIHIFLNKNVGGAGGFTRGMIEIMKVREKRNISHILVMDDDIIIEPEAIFRTCMILTYLKNTYTDAFIGGAMLRLDNRWQQTESGAMWNGGELISLKSGLDLHLLDACLFNEFEEHAQFNAWWYCVFPANIVNEKNLPMPIFIRGDDVEYGLRNMKHLILMNGICVWHEPFENKYSSFMYYYILRNRLIDNALHNMVIPKRQFVRLLYTQVMDELRIYRYKNAELLMRGVEDFLKGVSWLKKQDGEKLHQEIMKNGYKLQYLDDMDSSVQFLYPLYDASLHAVPDTSRIGRIINHYTVNGTYLKPEKPYVIVPTIGICQRAVYRAEKVLHYDYASRKGFVTVRDVKKCKECIRQLKKLTKKVNVEYDDAVRNFAADASQLINLDFWNQYLQIK